MLIAYPARRKTGGARIDIMITIMMYRGMSAGFSTGVWYILVPYRYATKVEAHMSRYLACGILRKKLPIYAARRNAMSTN